MKLSEIPGIGDIYDMDLSNLRVQVSSEMKKNKEKYEHLKAIGNYLFQIEKHIVKLQIICSEESDTVKQGTHNNHQEVV